MLKISKIEPDEAIISLNKGDWKIIVSVSWVLGQKVEDPFSLRCERVKMLPRRLSYIVC